MALLIDQIDKTRLARNSAKIDPDGVHMRRFLTAATNVFEVSNVADLVTRTEWLHRAPGGGYQIDPTRFPNIGPPYDNYWLEWAAPVLLSLDGRYPRIGCWCSTDDTRAGTDEWVIAMSPMILIGEGKDRVPLALADFYITVDQATGNITSITTEDYYRTAIGALTRETRNQRTRRGQESMNIKQDRLIAQRARWEAEGLTEAEMTERARPEYERLRAEVERLNAEVAEAEERQIDTLIEWLPLATLPVVLMAHSLLGCKNVEQDTHRTPEKVRRSRERKGRMAVTRFTTLAIRSPGSGRHASGDGINVGDGHVALHLVRGHFKTFTTERPLFGSRVGTYWWSPQARGNPEQGTVVKDYRVEV